MNGGVHRALLLPAALALLVACERQPSDLREWRPADHDHTTNPGTDQVEGGPDAGVAPELAAHGLNEVVIVAWEQNCVRCHGRFGHGDGPQGPMVRAADLTNQRWQATVSDDDILKVIRDGRGLMPAFPLPEPTLRMVVQLIRLLGQATTPGSDASGSADAGASPAPRASGAPSAHRGVTAPAKSAIAVPVPNAASAPAPPATSGR
jgi:mono/diheme cytochrome c family protein